MSHNKIKTHENPFNAHEFFGPPTEQRKLINDMIDRWMYEGETGGNNVEYEAVFEYGPISTQLKRIAGKADFKYWLGFRVWTPEQTACLIYEANPENYHLIADKPKINEFKLLAESKGNMTPYEWKLFAVENQLYIPKPIWDIEPSNQESTPEQQAETAKNGGDAIQESTSQKDEASGRPAERQAYFCEIWNELKKPKRNDVIWKELKKRACDTGPITNIYGQDSFKFMYEDGSIEQLVRKVFQNDMYEIRKKIK